MINKSLSTLGLVINHLTDGVSTHIPYRDSKLTRILSESLGGNSKTSLIITCSPARFNFDETVSTLKFGQRAKDIKNKAKVNRELSIQELLHLYEQEKAKNELKTRRIRMLEKLIIELGGVVPKDLLGAGQDTSKSESKLTENSHSFSSPPVRHEEREQEMTATSTAQMSITPFAGAQDNNVSGFSKSSTSEIAVGEGNVMQGKMEEALMQKMEEVV